MMASLDTILLAQAGLMIPQQQQQLRRPPQRRNQSQPLAPPTLNPQILQQLRESGTLIEEPTAKNEHSSGKYRHFLSGYRIIRFLDHII